MKRYDKRYVFVGIFVAIGFLALMLTLAAAPIGFFEAENVTGSGVAVGADSAASNGQYLQFGAGTVTPSQPDGPTTYMSDTELDQVKAKIQAGQQPWKSAYDKLITKANGELSQAPRSVVDNGGGHDLEGDRDDTADYKLAIEMSDAIYNLALAYRLSGSTNYASKALSLIDHWTIRDASYVEPDMGLTQGSARLRHFITGSGIIYGADLIWGYGGWTTAQRSEFTAWVQTLGTSARDNDADGAGSMQNKEAWRQSMIAVCGGFLEDQGLMDYAFGEFKRLLPTWIGKPGTTTAGLMIQEYKRGNNGVGDGGLSYSNYALNAMTQTAQVAWVHGVDLFRHTNQQVSLKYALDTIAPYNLNPSSWKYSPNDGITVSSFAYFEFVYKNLGEAKYLQQVNIKGRPAILNYAIHGNITVTHGRP